VTIAGILAACGLRKPPDPSSTEVLRIQVTASGEISTDGQPTTLEHLPDRLKTLKEVNGAVAYHRENPEADPHPNAMAVIQLVVEHKLPIRLSSKPDFSDVVDDRGQSHPASP
jgi:hypothetical protein